MVDKRSAAHPIFYASSEDHGLKFCRLNQRIVGYKELPYKRLTYKCAFCRKISLDFWYINLVLGLLSANKKYKRGNERCVVRHPHDKREIVEMNYAG